MPITHGFTIHLAWWSALKKTMSLPTYQEHTAKRTFLLWQCCVWIKRQCMSSPRRANHSQNVEQCQWQHVERLAGDSSLHSLQYSHPSQALQFYIFRGHLSWRDQYCSCHPIPALMLWCDGSLVIDTIKVVLSIQTEPISACTETPNKCLLSTFHQWLLCLRFFMSDIVCSMTYLKNVELFLIWCFIVQSHLFKELVCFY